MATTKNARMRKTTVFVARLIAPAGSADSAAAIRDELGSGHGEDHGDNAHQHGGEAVRQKSSVAGQITEIDFTAGPDAEDEQTAEHDEADDDGDLDTCKPVFGLTEVADGEKVDPGHHQQECC